MKASPKAERKPTGLSFEGTESMTKQSFKDDCDINQVMAKYQQQGIITHINENQASYGDCSSLTYQDSMQIVANANSMFEQLPSSVRKKFNNQPAAFLDFVQDPENKDKLQEMGLIKPTPSLETKKGEALLNTPAPGGQAPPAGKEDSDASASVKSPTNENKKDT